MRLWTARLVRQDTDLDSVTLLSEGDYTCGRDDVGGLALVGDDGYNMIGREADLRETTQLRKDRNATALVRFVLLFRKGIVWGDLLDNESLILDWDHLDIVPYGSIGG